MSDVAQGPGWWLASDGRWYPPQPTGLAVPAPPGAWGGRFTSLDPETAKNVMVNALVGGGAQISTASATNIIGNVETRKSASCLLAFILLLIMILPGILYLIFGGSTVKEPFSITITAQGSGAMVAGNGVGRGAAAVQYAIGQLPPG